MRLKRFLLRYFPPGKNYKVVAYSECELNAQADCYA